MSQVQKLFDGTVSPDVEKITPYIGGAVSPDAAFNINLLTTDGLLTTGTPLTNTITISPDDDLAAVEALAGVGVASRSGVNTWTTSAIVDKAVITGFTNGGVGNLGPLTDGQLVIGRTGDYPTIGTLTAGTNLSVTNAAGSITIAATTANSGLTWETIGASGALVVGKGYICNAGAALSFSLPATAAVGTEIALSLDGATSWTITQGAGQQIRFGSIETTAGAGGSLASTASGDTVHLVCSVADTKWNVISSIGNITVV